MVGLYPCGLRRSSQNIAAKKRLTSVPFAETHRVSIPLCSATVISVSCRDPLSQAVTPWPRPSCRTSWRMHGNHRGADRLSEKLPQLSGVSDSWAFHAVPKLSRK